MDGTRQDPVTPAIRGLDAQRQVLLQRLLHDRMRSGGTPAEGGDRHLKVSLFFFSADIDDAPQDKHSLVLDCAELADDLGLHAIWVPERHFDAFGAPYPSPGLLLAAIAARTKRIGLRAGSVVLPLHDPLLVAEEWGVLDSLSGGRAGLSLASGWHADDFVLNPGGFDSRREILESRIGDLRALWAGKSIERAGPGGRVVSVRAYPPPRRSPALWLTSSSNPQTWRTAARLGTHVLTGLLEQSVDDVARKAALYRSALAEAGRAPEAYEVTCMLHAHLAADPAVALERVRAPLARYLTAHMKLFEKFAASQDVGVNLSEVTQADRDALIEHGVRRYIETSGIFGSVDSCAPAIARLRKSGVTEVGCLVDFGLPREHVLDSVRELGKLNARMRHLTAAV